MVLSLYPFLFTLHSTYLFAPKMPIVLQYQIEVRKGYGKENNKKGMEKKTQPKGMEKSMNKNRRQPLCIGSW